MDRTERLRIIIAAIILMLNGGCDPLRPPGDTLVIAQVAEPRSLDPQVTTALNDFRILVNLFEGLVRYRPGTLEPAPALAESWEISDDGRVYTFQLKDGVRFHDGSRFDAEAVRFNFQRMLDPKHPYHDTGPFPLAFFFEAVESIEVVGPLAVRFRLDKPFAPFLSNLAYPAGLIVSPAAVERWGEEVGRHPSGTGPFRFVDWRPGERVRLERFAGYHGLNEQDSGDARADASMGEQASQLPGQRTNRQTQRHVAQLAKGQTDWQTRRQVQQQAGSATVTQVGIQDGEPVEAIIGEARERRVAERSCAKNGTLVHRLIFRPITDPMTRVAELLAGGVDVALELSPDNVAAFRERDGFQVLEATGPHLWFLILNTRDGPLSDVRVRRAVNLAIDPQVLTEDVLRQTAVPAAGPVPAAFDWANNPEVRPYRQDRQAARELLAEAGHGDGLRLRFLVPRGGSGMLAPLAMATAIQGDLARIGINAEIRSFEWNAYLARVNDGLDAEADIAEMAWMTNDPDTLPYLALRCDASPEQGGFNSGYYCNPKVDALIEQARRATDREQRARLYHRLERAVHEDAPWAVVASWRQSLVAREAISGLRLEPSFFLRLEQAAKSECGAAGGFEEAASNGH